MPQATKVVYLSQSDNREFLKKDGNIVLNIYWFGIKCKVKHYSATEWQKKGDLSMMSL